MSGEAVTDRFTMTTQGSNQSDVEVACKNESEVSVNCRTADFNFKDETRTKFLNYGRRLYQAALDGDWKVAEDIFIQAPYWIATPITTRDDTVLHVAITAKQTDFVLKLLDKMDEEVNDLLLSRDSNQNTPFCCAASSDEVEVAKAMVLLNRRLPNLKGYNGLTPLHLSVMCGYKEMALFLINETDDTLLTCDELVELTTTAIDVDLYDVALYFLNKYPHLAKKRNTRHETVLHSLAEKRIGTQVWKPTFWKSIISQCAIIIGQGESKKTKMQLKLSLQVVKRAWDEVIKEDENVIKELISKPWLLGVASEVGNVEFLTALIRSYPDVIWMTDDEKRDKKTIFHIAIENRQEDIFKLIHQFRPMKDYLYFNQDQNGNSLLHLVAELPPEHRLNCVSGAALQMQRELLWFETIKAIVQPRFCIAKNAYGKSPEAIFSESHEKLRKQGEDWLKKTSESCTLVAALLTTVSFTAAFTTPGSPALVKQASFIMFAVSNATSLFASTTSILMFLSILTSRYAVQDFLRSLPFKLMAGLTALFISIATMMMAFTSTFFITFEDKKWVRGPIGLLATVPVTLFAFQQYPLLFDMHRSTFRSWTIFHPRSNPKLTLKTKEKNV